MSGKAFHKHCSYPPSQMTDTNSIVFLHLNSMWHPCKMPLQPVLGIRIDLHGLDDMCYSGQETRCCLCRSSVMEGSCNACETLYQKQMPLKPLAALVVIVTYLFLATDQSSPTATAVGANTGF